VVAVAHDQPVAVLVALVGELGDVGVHLGPQRLGQHPPRALPDDLVDQRPRRAARVVGRGLVMNYLEHGRTFPNRRANAGPDQNSFGFQIFLGKVRPFTSPRRGPSTGSDHCSTPRPADQYEHEDMQVSGFCSEQASAVRSGSAQFAAARCSPYSAPAHCQCVRSVIAEALEMR
jgi:hypothetical protein